MNLSEQHRDRTNLPNADWEDHMRRLRPVLDLLKAKDRTLGEWYLKGETEREALQYPAYDGVAPAKAAIEALSREYGKKIKTIQRQSEYGMEFERIK
ncbi:hypothetical protein ACTJLC_12580 [Paraburkholderia sp. 22099]|uniref:hypothetical protein n=1 Tax=Paraburkholderia sp. 22099 TaxID=3453875 RepID=UPI003F831AB9